MFTSPAALGSPTPPNACSFAFPNQPGTPPGPIPIPYPNITANSAAPTKSMHPAAIQSGAGLSPEGSQQLANGQPLSSLGDQQRLNNATRAGLFDGSAIPTTLGDDAGTHGGVISGVNAGQPQPITGSPKVLFGQPAAGSNAPPVGQALSPSQARVIILG